MTSNKIISNKMISEAQNYFVTLLRGINPTTVTFALKTCLALVIGYALSFRFNFSPITTALTIIVLNTQYLGSSVDKALLRITGTFAGGGIAIVLMAILAQEKYTLLFTLAVMNAFLFYKMQGSRYPYAWFTCALALMIVGFSSLENPDNTFHAAVSRVSGVLLGIVTSLVVQGLLWPSKAGEDYEKQLRSILSQTCKLLKLKYSTYITDGNDANKIPKMEKNIILSTPHLETTLTAAARDTGRFSRFTKSYIVLNDLIKDLVYHIFDLGETFKNCAAYPDLILIINNSETYTETLNLVEQNLRKLIADCDLPRDGSIKNESFAVFEAEYKTKMDSLIAEFKSMELEPEKELALAIMLKKLAELSSLIQKIHSTLLSVENPEKMEFFNAILPEIFQIEKSFEIFSPRFVKAITSALIIMLASIFWIRTAWPIGYVNFLLFAWVLSYVNVISPIIPTRSLIYTLFCAAIIGFIMYFMALPRLDNFLQLASVIILGFVPFCYMMNVPSPLTAAFGMLGASWLVSFSYITVGQTLSFSTYMNTFIGIGGGVLLGILILSIISYRRPEKEFKKQLVSFFALCHKTVNGLDKHKPWTDKGRSILLGARRELAGKIKLIALWSTMLNYNRTDSYNRQKIGSLLSSILNIIFRLDSLERARREYKQESLITPVGKIEEEMCRTIIDRFSLLEHSIANGEQVPDFSDISGNISYLVTKLREAGKHDNLDEKSRQVAVQILLLTGFYQSLLSSLTECRDQVNSLDWNEFDHAYF